MTSHVHFSPCPGPSDPEPLRATALIQATRDAIARWLSQGAPAIEDIAAMLDVKVRTLQRRLAASSTTYSQLVGQVRIEESQRLLRETSLTHAEIASALAYSDPAHFTRAFIRWTGETPRAYRFRESSCSSGGAA